MAGGFGGPGAAGAGAGAGVPPLAFLADGVGRPDGDNRDVRTSLADTRSARCSREYPTTVVSPFLKALTMPS